ncbi:hypothetical protein CYMTET_45891 [Cymbomonas tetramitiformis]|uniref:Uncharacterized protein n=1 Tax=Cymbomonas tetramitiformis TaxID=36881 RepID=A0AAE0BZA5_9CHLO|nr:hypothetical protein CYMTET_45891 [Cymbomonas tetramitiformis]
MASSVLRFLTAWEGVALAPCAVLRRSYGGPPRGGMRLPAFRYLPPPDIEVLRTALYGKPPYESEIGPSSPPSTSGGAGFGGVLTKDVFYGIFLPEATLEATISLFWDPVD